MRLHIGRPVPDEFDEQEGRAEARLYNLFCAQASVESDSAEGPDAVIHGVKADGAHERGEFGRTEKAGNGFREIFVSRLIAGDKAANLRQHFTKIPAIEIPKQSLGRLGEFQNRNCAAGLEHALNFTQAAFVVGEIAKAESAGHQIKRFVCERKPKSIGFKKRHGRSSALVGRRRQSGAFRVRAHEHSMGEIRANDAGRTHASEGEG